MKTPCFDIQILATRSYDEVDSPPFYLEDALEDDIAERFDIEEKIQTESAETIPQIREHFAEIWIWQSSNMR